MRMQWQQSNKFCTRLFFLLFIFEAVTIVPLNAMYDCSDKQVIAIQNKATTEFNSENYPMAINTISAFIQSKKICKEAHLHVLLDSLYRYSVITENFDGLHKAIDHVLNQMYSMSFQRAVHLVRLKAYIAHWDIDQADSICRLLSNVTDQVRYDDLNQYKADLLIKKYLYDSAYVILLENEKKLDTTDLMRLFDNYLSQLATLNFQSHNNAMTKIFEKTERVLKYYTPLPEKYIEYLLIKAVHVNNQNRSQSINNMEVLVHIATSQNKAIRDKYVPQINTLFGNIYRDNYKIRKSDTLLTIALSQYDTLRASHIRNSMTCLHILALNRISFNDIDNAKLFLSKANSINNQINHPNPRTILRTHNIYNAIYARTKEYNLLMQNAKLQLAVAKQLPINGYELHKPYWDLIEACTYTHDTSELRQYLTDWQKHFEKYEENISEIKKLEFYKSRLIGYIYLDEPGTYLEHAEKMYDTYKAKFPDFADELKIYISQANYNIGNYSKSFDIVKNKFESAREKWNKDKSSANFNHYIVNLRDYVHISWENFESMPSDANKSEMKAADSYLEEYISYAASDHPTTERLMLYGGTLSEFVDIDAQKYLYFNDPSYFWKTIAKHEVLYNRRLITELLHKKSLADCASSFVNHPQFEKVSSEYRNLKTEILKLPHTQTQLHEQFNALSTKYHDLLDSIESQSACFEKWKKAKIDQDIKKITSTLLSSEDCLLFFNYFQPYFSAFIITKDTFFLNHQIQPNLLDKIALLRKSHSSYFSQGAPNLQEYIIQSNDLYNVLLKPIDTYLKKNIILLASEGFQTLPLDLLLKSVPAQATRIFTYPFLGGHHTISSINSLHTYLLTNAQKSKHDHTIAFAPFSTTDSILDYRNAEDLALRSTLRPLQSSMSEVLAISKSTNGKAFTGKHASLQNFIDNISTAKIIHIATHGNFDSLEINRSYLTFNAANHKNENLYYGQLTDLHIDADLVTLSACYSGMGQNINAEGIYSMAQGFTISGAKNVISALWPVPDLPTKELMILFYHEVKKGNTYAQSLADAKRTFIQKYKQWAHPAYWAGFVLNGR